MIHNPLYALVRWANGRGIDKSGKAVEVVGTSTTATINEIKERLMAHEAGAGEIENQTTMEMVFRGCLKSNAERTRPGVIL